MSNDHGVSVVKSLIEKGGGNFNPKTGKVSFLNENGDLVDIIPVSNFVPYFPPKAEKK